MNLRSLGVALVVAMVAGSLSAQSTWKVNCNGGPGVHFTDLPPAVAAAAPGDTILLYETPPWCTQGYTAPTIDKPLRILGFLTTFPPGNPEPSFAGIRGLITITGIPAGQQVLLSNINMRHSPATFPYPPSGFSITTCDGDVLIEDFWFENDGLSGQVLRIEDCANVVLRGCEFRIGGAPIQVIDSNVLLTWTSVSHLPPFWPAPYGYAQTAEALYLHNSTATLADTLLLGSDNYGGAIPGTLNARAGVVLNFSTLRAGAGTTIYGGWVSGPHYTFGYTSQNPLASPVYKDPRAVINNVPPAGPSPITTDIHATYHSWVIADEPFRVSVAGPSNGFALLLFGDWKPSTPTPFGELAIDPLTAVALQLVALPPPYGFLDLLYHCPASAPNGYGFVFQALTLSPSGQLGFTVPSPLTVGWEHGRIP